MRDRPSLALPSDRCVHGSVTVAAELRDAEGSESPVSTRCSFDVKVLYKRFKDVAWLPGPVMG